MTHAPRTHSETAITWALRILACVAILAGAAGLVLGPVTGPGLQSITVSTDSEYRFLSGIWLATGLVLWWSSHRPRDRTAHTRVVLLTIIAGGVGRAISLIVAGYPEPYFLAALCIELLGVPLVLYWHKRTWTDVNR